MDNNYISYNQRILEHINAKNSFVSVTMTDVRGSAPQVLGAKIIVTKEGLDFGTVGGGKIEAHCLKVAGELLTSSKDKAISYTWNLQRDIGMTCGGEVTIYFEAFKSISNWKVAVFGAGHISQELTRLLSRLDCDLTVYDTREEWTSRFNGISNVRVVCCEEMAQEVVKLPDDTFVVIVTKGHSGDVPILFEAIRNKNFPYVGAIGSIAKRNKMEKELLSRGLTKEELTKFICPMGEKFGDNTPIEISLSVIAQLLKERDARS